MISALRHFRKPFRLLSFLGLTALLAACQVGVPGSGPTGPRVSGQTINVAMLLPYGSASAGDDLVARSLENAARLALTDVPDIQVNLTVYNTAANASQAAAVAQQAVSEGADVILGPLRSDAAAAVGVAVARSNINVLSFSNNTEIAGGNVFVLGHTFQNTATRMMSYSAAQGRNRVLILHARNLAGEVAREAVERAAVANGATITGRVSYEFSQNGVVAALPTVMSTVRSTDTNALMMTGDAAGALPLFAQLLPENGLDTEATRVMGLSRWDVPPQTLELSGLQGGWFALPDPSAAAQFNARYEAANGTPAHILAAIGYDAMRAVAETAATQGRLGVAELTASSGFAGANGVFRLRADGTNERAMAVVQVENNQVAVIDPAPRRLGPAGF
ncbi:ABC transporter substrate-binding protein [Roseobacter sp. HKCCD9010]|uniref:penicillin-binding protein activator n=1 Tax=unclassified Roseobacter TaxID=196798 RepID=UPI0014919411|nr:MULTISPECIES: penicillin-binding protein activator [unclassified Roseobacter]MBF9049056.1 ABC transporter substrate-binding protein [Rhodobacterales bacterium HKCCD4356]NNV11056.1 ABC transporter substrate-binding protein [Roseobacter sp. HKCCD7357]NNV15240.1 ABC transporter substrate-binding protein [Roseobacter sp. HKCCD8768]NNV24700.1 ABC transporter substrate-binding protein [Roseobacter sp. HKCCD8192]NNV28956.1 ABC transporter substrate-binding protein [Roseobacter sp. HKCCD9061]